MNGANQGTNLTGLADTGQWKLIVEVSQSGLCALLKNVIDPYTPKVVIARVSWEKNSEKLLENIESAIYENPKILDDFATQIIVKSSKAVWIPSLLIDDEDYDPEYFTKIYPADTTDISADIGLNETCLFTLTPGLNSFLNRTLPGCRISSHLSVLKNEYERLQKILSDSENSNHETVFINIRKDEADIFAFKGSRFYCGAVHPWKDITDIVYKVALICQCFRFDNKATNIVIGGNVMPTDDVAETFSKFFPAVFPVILPGLSASQEVSLTQALAAGENINFTKSI